VTLAPVSTTDRSKLSSSKTARSCCQIPTVLIVLTEEQVAAADREVHTQPGRAKPRRIQPTWVCPIGSVSKPDASMPIKSVPAVAIHQQDSTSRLDRSIEEQVAYKKERAMRRNEWRSRNAPEREGKMRENRAKKRKEKKARAKERKKQLKSLTEESRVGSDGKGGKVKGEEPLAPPTTSKEIGALEKDFQARENALKEREKIIQMREVAVKAREEVLQAKEDTQGKENVRIHQEEIGLGDKQEGR
jgi:hypothetical protein